MSEFTDAYVNLLIKQYWEKPQANAEIALQAGTWETIRDVFQSFGDEFDLDLATGDRLDIIGKIVGMPRIIPFVIAKVAFGFDDNANSRGFDSKFATIADVAPFLSKFEPSRTPLTLDDSDYRSFIKAKISTNTGSAYMVSDDRISIQDVINTIFDGQAYVVDKKDMSLILYVSPAFDVVRLLAIQQLGLLPKPQAVQYAIIIQAAPGETFSFADNPNALGWGSKFDVSQVGGVFAQKVII